MIDTTGFSKNESIFTRDVKFEINFDGTNYSISTKDVGESNINLSDLKSTYSTKRNIPEDRIEEILNLFSSESGSFYSDIHKYNRQ